MPSNNFDVRMGCDNCGHIDIYHIPLRSIVTDSRESDSHVSGYSRPSGNDEQMLFCYNCQTPKLSIFWWVDNEDALNPAEPKR